MKDRRNSFSKRFHPSRLFRGEKPVEHPIQLTHRRIFIIPTKRGMMFVLMIILILLIAFVYNNNLAYFLAFLLGGVYLVTILHSFKTLSGLIVKPGQTYSVFAGEAAGFSIQLCNQSAQNRINIHVISHDKQQIFLKGHETKTLTLHQPTDKRGRLACKTITIASSYPLGLFRAWSPLRFALEAFVYPQPAELLMPLPSQEKSQSTSSYELKGQEDFYGLKTYQNGDPINQIHWKALAKGQGLYIKQYLSPTITDLWLDYAVAPGKNMEERLRHLCRWVIEAEHANLPYGLMLPGLKIEPSLGKRHQTQCLEALAIF